MPPRSIPALTRHLCLRPRTLLLQLGHPRPQAQIRRRFASSSSSSSSSSAPSAHVGFYKTFGRPVAKVLLMAIFTYQLVYWAWAKLEQDEIRAERQEEMDGLEAKVKELQDAQKS